MISNIFALILFIILAPIILFLQCINCLVTIVQYPFVKSRYDNIQELFTENSSYVTDILLPCKRKNND